MSRGKLIALSILGLPLAEIAAFAAAASIFGLAAAAFALVALSLLGIAILVMAGRIVLARAFAALSGPDPAAIAPADALIVPAAILIALPGFVTGALGLILLLPPVRRRIAERLRPRRSGAPDMIDLESGEWERKPQERLRDDARDEGKS